MANLSPTITSDAAVSGLPDAGPHLTATAGRGRAPIDLVAESQVGQDEDGLDLLRRRLRQMVLLFLAAYAAFLLRDILLPHRLGLGFQKVMFLIVTPLQLLLVGVTWSHWANSLKRLRAIELVVLGVFVLTVGSIQFDWMCNWSELPYYVRGDRAMDGQVMVGNTWVIPWFALIVGYPAVVPNTVRRALAIAGCMAIMPVLVTLAAAIVNPELGLSGTWVMFIQYAIWMPLGVGFAAYGAHQAGFLRRQASEAKRFGQYRLTRRLGGGGMGEVYLAEHLLLRRPSVIKVVRPDRANSPAVLKRFEREVQILATLTHWNTVEVFDYGHTADGTFYYVMEYLPGFDLDQLVNAHGALPSGRVVRLLRQLCGALAEAHEAGLIHRDVKPGNVMICRRGGVPDVAKLLDFGLVQGAEDQPDSQVKLTVEGAVLGTPHFMSPEQASGKPTDARSDIYSLGATAYFLLCGKPPFGGGTMEVIAAHMLQEPLPLASACADVPKDLSDVIMRCMAKKPAERFATVMQLDAALAACECARQWGDEQAAAWWAGRECV